LLWRTAPSAVVVVVVVVVVVAAAAVIVTAAITVAVVTFVVVAATIVVVSVPFYANKPVTKGVKFVTSVYNDTYHLSEENERFKCHWHMETFLH